MGTFLPVIARARPYLALLICPVMLACSFVVTAVVLLSSGTSMAALEPALKRSPTVPLVLGFGGAFLVGRWFAALDGRSLAELGWSKLSWVEVVIAVALIAVLLPLHLVVIFPAIAEVDPSFEPALPKVGVASAFVSFIVAVAAEETIYRGHSLTLLRERLGAPAAIVITSLGYALLAPGAGLALKTWALALGVVLASVRLWRGSSWAAAALHLSLSLGPKLLVT